MKPSKTCTILMMLDTSLIITWGGHTHCTPANWGQSSELSDVAKLYALTAGCGWVAVDGKRTVLHTRGLYVIPPHHRLTYAATPELTVDWLHFLPVSPLLDAQLTALNEVYWFPVQVASRWRPVTQALGEFCAEPTPALTCRVQAMLLDVIGVILEHQSVDSRLLVEGIERLLPAIRFMDDRVMNPPSLKEIAQRVNLSPEHFHRQFRLVYRTTPFEYLQRRRMAKAHRLLIQGTMSVKEVATACGYDDPYYFSRVFRRQYGCSPRDVRLGKVQPIP